MDAIRKKARESLQDVEFTGRLGDVQVIDVHHSDDQRLVSRSRTISAKNLVHHRSYYGSDETKPGYLTRAWSREKLFDRIKTSNASFAGSCLFVYISLSHGLALDIDRDLFLEIYDAMGLDPLMLRFLGQWDPGSCQPSSTHSGDSVYINYMRMRGHCMMWNYDSVNRRVRGIIMPKSFNPNVHSIFRPDFKFLNTLVANIKAHGTLIAEPHGFTFICCLSIIERVSAALADAYAAIALVEQGTGHSTWNENRPMTIDDMTRSSKDIGRAKHVLIITKRHVDCVKAAYAMVTAKTFGPESPAIEPFRFMRHDLEALDLELESLKERAENQMDVLKNLLAREEARASIKLADASLKIAEAAKGDSGAMKTVAVMTMLFLPATFFAALFSMPLLQWGSLNVVHDQFWIYWWYACYQQALHESNADDGVAYFPLSIPRSPVLDLVMDITTSPLAITRVADLCRCSSLPF